jgi:hypothetical protein
MFIDFLISVFKENKENEAIVWKDKVFTYEWLLERNKYWKEESRSEEIERGTIAIVEADFSPNSVALLLALIEHECIFGPTDAVIGTKMHSCSINANNSATELGEKSASTIAIVPLLIPSDLISFFQYLFLSSNHS